MTDRLLVTEVNWLFAPLAVIGALMLLVSIIT